MIRTTPTYRADNPDPRGASSAAASAPSRSDVAAGVGSVRKEESMPNAPEDPEDYDESEPTDTDIFYGNDLAAAFDRARSINGYVIYSKAPGDLGALPIGRFGYWSTLSGFVRAWEREVYSPGSRLSFAQLQRREDRYARSAS